MHNKDGFLLMEFLVYFFLLTFLSTLMAHFLVSTQQRLGTQRIVQNQLINSWFAADRFVSDAKQAPTEKGEWKKIEHNCLIWRQGEYDICWQFNEDALYRIEGTWDYTTHSWTKHTKNMVAHTIRTCGMRVINDAAGMSVKGCSIDICMKNDEHIIHRVAAVGRG